VAPELGGPDLPGAERNLKRIAGLAVTVLAIAVLVMIIDQQIKRAIIGKAAEVGRQLVKAQTLLAEAERLARGPQPDHGPEDPGPGNPGGVRGPDLVVNGPAVGTPAPDDDGPRESSAVGWPDGQAQRPGSDG
jgi:hypothetical protein